MPCDWIVPWLGFSPQLWISLTTCLGLGLGLGLGLVLGLGLGFGLGCG